MITFCYFVLTFIGCLILWIFLKLKFYKQRINSLLIEISNNNNRLSVLISENQNFSEEIKQLKPISLLVKQSPNAIMLMNKVGDIISINDGFEKMYGYNYEDFIAARGSNYRRTSFSSCVNDRISKIFSTRTPVKYEALNIAKDGKELWTQTALMPIIDDNNEIIGMVTIDTDIHTRITSSDLLIERMEDLNKKIDLMGNRFNILVEESHSLFTTINSSKQLIEQTSQIVDFIKNVSDQTKILGINASIEARHKGLNNKGFRVIATEIVEISNKTINSVEKISRLVKDIGHNQDKLLKEKMDTELEIKIFNEMISQLKKDIKEIETVINEFKVI